VERTCAAIVCEVLGIDRIGVEDNFFKLGGNSIFVIQIHGRLKQAFGRDISIVELFRNPRIAYLAKVLSGGEDGAERRVSVASERGLERREASASHRNAVSERRERARRGGRGDGGGRNE
jgi:acyl carrier protein